MMDWVRNPLRQGRRVYKLSRRTYRHNPDGRTEERVVKGDREGDKITEGPTEKETDGEMKRTSFPTPFGSIAQGGSLRERS